MSAYKNKFSGQNFYNSAFSFWEGRRCFFDETLEWKAPENKNPKVNDEPPTELDIPAWAKKRKDLALQCESKGNCQKKIPIGNKNITFEGIASHVSFINKKNPAVQKLLENLEGMKNFSVGNEKIFVEGKNLKFFLTGVGSCLVTPNGWNILQKSPNALEKAQKFIAKLEGKNPDEIKEHFSSSHTNRISKQTQENKEYEPQVSQKITVVETQEQAEGDELRISKEEFENKINNEKEHQPAFANCEVQLCPGNYSGPLVLRSPGMKLIGTEGVNFSGGSKNNPCVKMGKPGQEISNISFRNNNETTAIVSEGYDNKIEKCHISEVERGIVVNGSNTLIKNNTIDGFYDDGMFITNSYATITGNHIKNLKSGDDSHHHDGIQFSAGKDKDRYNPEIGNPKHTISGSVIAGNTIELGEKGSGNLQGVTSFEGFADGWTIYGNSISVNTDHGISINGGRSELKNFMIEKNNFTKARGGKNKPMIKLRPPRTLKEDGTWAVIDDVKIDVKVKDNDGEEIDLKEIF